MRYITVLLPLVNCIAANLPPGQASEIMVISVLPGFLRKARWNARHRNTPHLPSRLQLVLATTGIAGELSVSWTTFTAEPTPETVTYSQDPSGKSATNVTATSFVFNDSGNIVVRRIHTATMTGLTPNQDLFYSVGGEISIVMIMRLLCDSSLRSARGHYTYDDMKLQITLPYTRQPTRLSDPGARYMQCSPT
jgi:hypothetical protein